MRYVGDCLVVINDLLQLRLDPTVDKVIDTFKTVSDAINFICERPSDMSNRFLDLKLKLQNTHVYLEYQPHLRKQLISYDSTHSKLINRGAALTCLCSCL